MNKVAIAGGGIGGLIAALLLRRQGKIVTIYERMNRLGGRLAFEQNGTYRIDQGPTIVLLPEMLLDILAEAGIDRSRIPLVRCDPMYRIYYADGTVLHKWSDRERQLEELGRLFPGEQEGFIRYMAEMKRSFVQGKKAFLERPFLRKRDFFTVRNIALLTKLRAYKSVRSLAAEYFKDKRLHDAFSLQTLYIGGAPFEAPGLYSLLPYAEHEFGVWCLKGGYASLIPLLEEELARQGVAVKKRAAVKELLISDGRCYGVRTDEGETSYDAVIYNGEFPSIAGVLPVGEATRPKNKRKDYKPSSGCVLIYLGLNKQWPEALAHQFFLPPSLEKGLGEIFKENRLPDDPSFYVFYPSAFDDAAAPAGESAMYVLIPSPAAPHVDWGQETPKLVERVLSEAERRGFPGLREAIRWQQVRTPADAEADGLYKGGSFGIAPTLLQSAVFRPQIVPYGIEGLYAAGASVHPGGGVPIVMQGARLLAQHLSPAGAVQAATAKPTMIQEVPDGNSI
ncbi:phytoene desaturase family protein [Paenibacillus algorifonticola]|uniref:phytoene desaturase family protein n=1 Tax=Paenibacillus algorifonticola TaxID=684063 RepID=UPI003D2AA753